jgi:hypothetical protein
LTRIIFSYENIVARMTAGTSTVKMRTKAATMINASATYQQRSLVRQVRQRSINKLTGRAQ